MNFGQVLINLFISIFIYNFMKIKLIKNNNLQDFINWSIWECPTSKFNWEYDKEEHCFIIKVDIIVSTKNQTVNISEGDYVIFPKNLKCYWEVIKPVKKYYIFK